MTKVGKFRLAMKWQKKGAGDRCQQCGMGPTKQHPCGVYSTLCIVCWSEACRAAYPDAWDKCKCGIYKLKSYKCCLKCYEARG